MCNISLNPVASGKTARRNTISFWTAITRARKSFDAQLTKSNEIKFKCLLKYTADVNDKQLFYEMYMKEVVKLTDSKRFCNACESREINPEILASHVVFLGSAVVNSVKNNGIDVLGSNIKYYTEGFLPSSSQAFASSYGLDAAPYAALEQ